MQNLIKNKKQGLLRTGETLENFNCISVFVLTAFNLLESFQHRFLSSFPKPLKQNSVSYNNKTQEETKGSDETENK